MKICKQIKDATVASLQLVAVVALAIFFAPVVAYLSIVCEKEERRRIKAHADDAGMSVDEYVAAEFERDLAAVAGLSK